MQDLDGEGVKKTMRARATAAPADSDVEFTIKVSFLRAVTVDVLVPRPRGAYLMEEERRS